MDEVGTSDWAAILDVRAGLADVSDSSTVRAITFLRELAAQAERHGYLMAVDTDAAQMSFFRGSQCTTATLSEEVEDREVLVTPDETQTKVYDWQRVSPEVVASSTGRLALELGTDHTFSGRRRRWADRSRWKLEDKTAEIVAELDARADIAAQRKVEEEQAREHRQREWHEAMESAGCAFVADVRTRVLESQLLAWTETASIRAYCDALELAVAQEPETREPGRVREWISWARNRADEIDPLTQSPTLPEVEIRPEDLRPYLGKWSPYGPEERR